MGNYLYIRIRIRDAILIGAMCLVFGTGYTDAADLTIQAGQSGKPISPDLIGVFFEDLNYAADGCRCRK